MRFLFLVPLVLLFTCAEIALSPGGGVERHKPDPRLRNNWQADVYFLSSPDPHRTVFAYSVIPGGVRDGEELTAAFKDPVVAEHYSDFRLAGAHTIHLDRATAMFVSYRFNDQVYWTRNRMLIPAGEALISDGQNLARERCGNRLSPVPRTPVLASEPPPEKLENAEFIPPLLADLAPAEAADPLTPPFANPAGGLSASAGGFLLVPPFATSASAAPLPPRPVATPEPDSLTLFLGGVLLCGLGSAALSRGSQAVSGD